MSAFINNKDTNSCPPDGYRALSTSELRELLQDEGKMDHIVGLGEKFQEMQVDRETLLASNRRVAEESLAQRPRLTDGKLQLAEKYRELSNLATACWEKQRRLEGHGQKHSLQTAQNLLRDEVARAEGQSEELLESFMEGGIPLDDFLDSFQSSRRSYHVRRAQVEKVHEAGQAGRQQGKLRRQQQEQQEQQRQQEDEEKRRSTERLPEPTQRPNGHQAAPPRIFQLRYGLTPAILLPHFPLSSSSSSAPSAPGHHHHHHLHHHLQHRGSTPPPDSPGGQTHILSPGGLSSSGHGQPVGLRVIGQLQGGWPPGGRPVRLQQLYRPSPQQPEPPYR